MLLGFFFDQKLHWNDFCCKNNGTLKIESLSKDLNEKAVLNILLDNFCKF